AVVRLVEHRVHGGPVVADPFPQPQRRGAGRRRVPGGHGASLKYVLVQSSDCDSTISDLGDVGFRHRGQRRAGGGAGRARTRRAPTPGTRAGRPPRRQPRHGRRGVPDAAATGHRRDRRAARYPHPRPATRGGGTGGAAAAPAVGCDGPVVRRAGPAAAAGPRAAPAPAGPPPRAGGRLRRRRTRARAGRARPRPAGRRRGARGGRRGDPHRRRAGRARTAAPPPPAPPPPGGRGGDRVAVEDPGWANLLDLVAALGLVPVGVPVDADGPLPAALDRALAGGARAVIVTARAHNPTGAAVTADRAADLRAVLAAHPATLLIEDDHAAELSRQPLHPLAGATGAWAFVRSVSKPYGPDLRVAVLAGDEATVARVEGRMRVGTGWVS